MQKEIIQWIEALESGKYKQGDNALCRIEDGVECFCCLGVFLETLGYKASGRDLTGRKAYKINEVSEFTIVPSSLAWKYGLTGSMLTHLITMNDTHRNTFAEIAEFIKTLPLEKFKSE